MPLKVTPPALLRAGDAPVYNRAGLAAWHAALANRTAAPAKVVWIGDSITDGCNATSYGTRWVDYALARLRQDHPTTGVAGGFNYLPAQSVAISQGASPPQGQPYAAQLGAMGTLNNGFGFGGRSSVFNASGDGVTYNVTGTSVGVFYAKGGGLGTLSIRIDGGTATTIATAAGSVDVFYWASAALTAGAHTVTITNGGGGAVYFGGLAIFNGDEAAGVQGYEAGHYGVQIGGIITTAFFTSPYGLVLPHLAVLALGTNDYSAQTSIAAFKASYAATIASLRTKVPTASIALLAYSRRGDMAVQPIGWDQYVRALYDVADADTGGINGASGVAVIDLSARLPNAATTGTVDALGLYSSDRVHYGPKGHALIGEAVARALAL